MLSTKELQEKDLQHIWHPCSQMKDYEAFPPIVIKSGSGVWLTDSEGKRYLDAVSSWWVNLFGHANKRIGDALYRQANTLEHVIFANFTHEPAINLAERVTKLAPTGLNRVFFGDNGSSAVEIALKLSFQYHQQTGNPQKTKFAALTDAYHGETLGALSVGGMDLYNQVFNPLLLDVVRVDSPDCFRCPYDKDRHSCTAECFEAAEKMLAQQAHEIAAFIIEPMVQCAAGMKIYSPVYLKKLREACDHYDIHLIADEIAVGFGRTGKLFASEHADISPDIMCLSKGLTAGYMPLSLVLMTDEIYHAFYDDYATMKAFLHSHSYSGNPLGCAVALETLAIFEEDQVILTNLEKSEWIRHAVCEKLMDLPQIGEFRQLGMIGAVELVADQDTKAPFASELRVGYQIYKIALEKGVLLRPLGNILYFMPPYVISKEEVEHMVQVARESIIEWDRLQLSEKSGK